MRYKWIAVLVIVLIVALAVMGCSSDTPEEAALGLIVTDDSSSKPAEGQVAPDFRLETLDGEAVALSDFQGKPVMLNFWASWCGPCQQEIPYMVEAYADADDQFEIVAVNIQESTNTVRDFADSAEMTFSILLDDKASVATGYSIRGIPTSMFLDSDGVIVAIHEGTLTEAQLQSYLDMIIE